MLEAGKLQKRYSFWRFVLWGFFWLHSYLDINKDLTGQGTENIVFLNSKCCSLESY